jgi:predicted unusual protein kinase regulating ubiquinone biosynthesis (AarF/ABC1/UbiB family)
LLRPLCALPAHAQVKTDWASLIDNWAVRFLHEMDYTREAANAQLFRCVVSIGTLVDRLQQKVVVHAAAE